LSCDRRSASDSRGEADRHRLGFRIPRLSSLTIEPVAKIDQPRAIATLVSAFIADPVERWLYPSPFAYLGRFPAFAAAFGGEAFERQTVWSLEGFAAVAMWLPPGAEPDGDAIVAALSGSVSAEKHADTFAVLEQMDTAHPKDRHWYLPWLGVDCARQGAGLGSNLLEQCLARVDADHSSAFLETPNPRTVPFYERHGFRVTSISQAGACPPVTSMLRLAQ
jgi:ribosomal protein S18 acetylase RimI-like enzyme